MQPFSDPSLSKNVERVLYNEAQIQTRVEEIAAQISRDYRSRSLMAISVLNGGLVFTADLVRRIPLPLELGVIRAASYHDGIQSTGKVLIEAAALGDLRGRDILLVDDILDTGLTLTAICEQLKADYAPASIRIAVLLEKRKARSPFANAKADYVGFEIEDEFVIGYGLDYQGYFRNLPFIGVLKQL